MKLKINSDEFEDGIKVIVKILDEKFILYDFYEDDKEVIHVTFRKVEDDE